MRLVSIDMLEPEMRLAFPVYFKQALVLPAGRDQIARFIPNLKNMGIHYVYVEDPTSEGIVIPDAITEQTRFDSKTALRKVMENYEETTSIHINDLSITVDDVINDILKNREVQISLNDIGTVDEYTYMHSVNVTIYSLLIADSLGYDRKMMEKLAFGTLLHDIGKTIIDPDLQFKAGKLNEEEFEYMKLHAEYGYKILSKHSAMPEISKRIALYHHERLDGSGYPKALQGNEIPEFARIVAIADVYDALISDRCYKQKWPTHKAVDYLIEKSGTLFETEYVRLFLQKIAIYPNGSMVQLSDGTIAIVKQQNRSFPLRPVVRVIYDKKRNKVKPFEIDLMKKLSLTILQAELEIDWK